MSNQAITLEEIEAAHAKVAEMISQFKTQETSTPPQFIIEIPAAKFELLPGEAVDVTWEEAKAWAKAQGGELPTRQEMLALYANLKGEFEPVWYWTSEQHADYSDYAWMQHFFSGNQSNLRKSYECRARAVRRINASIL